VATVGAAAFVGLAMAAAAPAPPPVNSARDAPNTRGLIQSGAIREAEPPHFGFCARTGYVHPRSRQHGCGTRSSNEKRSRPTSLSRLDRRKATGSCIAALAAGYGPIVESNRSAIEVIVTQEPGSTALRAERFPAYRKADPFSIAPGLWCERHRDTVLVHRAVEGVDGREQVVPVRCGWSVTFGPYRISVESI
jgi:hypothetical protein